MQLSQKIGSHTANLVISGLIFRVFTQLLSDLAVNSEKGYQIRLLKEEMQTQDGKLGGLRKACLSG